MKHIKDLATEIQNKSTTQIQAGSSNTTLNTAAADYIGKIFEKLIVLCPAWKTAIDGDATKWSNLYKIELTAALKDVGVKTGEQIKAGLSAVRLEGKPFLPAPGEFARLCTGKTEDGLSHNTAAYTNRDFDTYGQRQICHKRSEEEAKAGLNRISALRASAKLPKLQKEPKSDEKPAIDPDILKKSRLEMAERVKAVKTARKL